MAQTTRIAIRKGFLELLEQRPLDKISVVDIAEHCGVNRNTFYYYYCDIYALVREVLDTELDSVLNAQPPCESWYQLLMRVTAFMRANRRAVYHLYRSNQRDLLENEYYQVAYRAVEGLVRRTAADSQGFTLPGWEPERLALLETTLRQYEKLTPDDLRANYKYFLDAVIPVCEEVGIRMACHPDDPAWPIFGLPRIAHSQEDFDKILEGITLSDGEIKADELEFIDPEDHRKVGIEIHSGKNRIVRRIFESLGYDVKALDRVYFAGLTKKGLKKGEWRYLTEGEANVLKMGSYV